MGGVAQDEAGRTGAPGEGAAWVGTMIEAVDAIDGRGEIDEGLPVLNARRVVFVRGRVEVMFPFVGQPDRPREANEETRALVGWLKDEVGAHWCGRWRVWHFRACVGSIRKLVEWGKPRGFVFAECVQGEGKRLVEQARAQLLASRAVEPGAEGAGEIEVPAGLKLRPYQEAGIAYMVRARRCLNADEMGLGKTVQTLLALREAGALPAVIVCPASLKYNWRNEARTWLPGVRVDVLESKDGSGDERGASDHRTGLVIVNYDILAERVEEVRALGVKAVVFDEAHVLKNWKTKRHAAAKALVRGMDVRFALTGTPLDYRPASVRSLLCLLGRIDEFGGFEHFAQRYCGAKEVKDGKGNTWTDVSGATNLPELQSKLRAFCMVRRLKKDVLAELPDKQRVRVMMRLSGPEAAEYRRAEKDIVSWVRSQAGGAGGTDADAMKLAFDRARAAATKAQNAPELVKMNALRQITSRGKLAGVVEWVESLMETGQSLVLFGWHREVVDGLAAKFEVVPLTGDTPARERQRLVDDFQRGKTKLFVSNIKAGGVGLTLTKASNVAFVEQSWSSAVMDQAEDRCHRIGQLAGVTCWYFVASDTIDEQMWEVLGEKREISRAGVGDR